MKAEAEPKTQKLCWWCERGSSPENPITQEHVIAKWVAGMMDGSGMLKHAYREHGADEDARSWQSREPSFKVSDVCRECNNGWMSELEGDAKRRLPPFTRGKRGLRINYVNAPVLARWAAKPSMMFQACESTENRVVPPEHFVLVRTADVLPTRDKGLDRRRSSARGLGAVVRRHLQPACGSGAFLRGPASR